MPNSPQNSLSSVKILNLADSSNPQHYDGFDVESISTSNDVITLENEELAVSFSTENGLMKSVTTKRDGIKMQVCVRSSYHCTRTKRL